MAKLKLKNLSNIGDVLTSGELKFIYGGASGSPNCGSANSKCCCTYTEYDAITNKEKTKKSPLQAACESDCANQCHNICYKQNPELKYSGCSSSWN